MPEIVIPDNTKKAVAFLQALFPGKRVNIVAIDPHSQNVTAITRSISHPEDASMEPSARSVNPIIANFIEHHNLNRNVYYSVNTPTDDAPDNKLNKENFDLINFDLINEFVENYAKDNSQFKYVRITERLPQ